MAFTLNGHRRFPRLEADHASVADLEFDIPADAPNSALVVKTVTFVFDSEVTTSVRVGFKRDSDETVIYTPDAAETLTSKVVGLAQCPFVLAPGDTLVVNTGDATNCQINVLLENGDA